MIGPAPIQINVKWLPDGAYFLSGDTQGTALEPEHLRSLLFAWHESSFFGTFIETAGFEGADGVRLGAEEALDFFAKPCWNEHVRLQWSEDGMRLLDAAPELLEAREQDRIVPDYGQWRKGRLVWKVLPASDGGGGLEVGGVVGAWLDFLMAERLPLAHSRLALWDGGTASSDAEEGPAGPAEGSPLELFEDERDWLVSIGWLPDEAPFRVCLQLQEPEVGSVWSMAIVLQDRVNPSVLVECAPDGTPLGRIGGEGTDWVADEADAVEVEVEGALAWHPESVGMMGEADRDLEEAVSGWNGWHGRHGAVVPEHWGDPAGRIRRTMAKWWHLIPWLRDGKDEVRRFIDYNEAWDFLMDKSLRLVELGLPVLLPSWWEQLRSMKPRLKARVRSAGGGGAGPGGESLFGMNQLMQFDWKLALGGMELSEEEFEQLMKQNRQLTQIRGQWVLLDPALLTQVQQLMKQVRRKDGMTFRDVLAMHLLSDADGVALGDDWIDEERDGAERFRLELELNEHLRQFIDQLSQASAIPRIEAPESFQGTLRNYQVQGSSWLLFLRQFGLGACLADDMGLGKTIQMITYLLHIQAYERPDAPSLLICPTSVLGNWQKELERFAPTLRVKLHYGPNRSKGDAFLETAVGCDLIITSYALAYLDEEELTSMNWSSICLDEAQNIKNAYTKQATSIRKLTGGHRIAMTGTPIENRLTELWSIFDFINPGYLGPLREFNSRFSGSVERDRDTDRIGQLQRLVKPFLLRRVKKDPAIELDLPDKLESKTYLSLTAEQAALYEGYIHDLFEKLDRLSPMERRGLILASLTKLKQVCNHPAAFLKEGGSGAAGAKRLAGRSNKLERLIEMVRELRQEGDSCLIFTQFVEMGKLIERALAEALGEPVLFLHGGTPKAHRDRMIERFQRGAAALGPAAGGMEPADESGDEVAEVEAAVETGKPAGSPLERALDSDAEAGVFILSLRAGGIGLNLTAANHVFHFDRWWNPAVENQATDRAFRIGQTKHVQVHKFITLGTLEERIDEMIERKQGLSQQIVGAGEQWITELSTDELRDLFTLRRQWMD
ncbi:DEAD/DEAH box helicase [Paenibacillus koleovorans]|uniref:DEAD/DEAH box helicase n=1 Tax=Paenibacillus koleovorans TaxID=121608 RepID=UPI0013E29664|nr:DEAD/DEAH box helicase [Paenibacillus koleovorans]